MLCIRFWLCYYSYSTCTWRKLSGDSKTITPFAAILPESLAILHYILLLNILKAGILWLILPRFHSHSAVPHEEYKMFAFVKRLWWTYFNTHSHIHTYPPPTHTHKRPSNQYLIFVLVLSHTVVGWIVFPKSHTLKLKSQKWLYLESGPLKRWLCENRPLEWAIHQPD